MARRTTRLATAVACALMVLGATGVWASIPDSAGVIHGCYLTSGNPNVRGVLRVIDTEVGEQCGSGETAITWNQEGPQGATGPQGPIGATGAQGPAGSTMVRLRVSATLSGGATTTVGLGSFTQLADAVAVFSGEVTYSDCGSVPNVGVFADTQKLGGFPNNEVGFPVDNGYLDFVPSTNGEHAAPFLFEPGIDTTRAVVATIRNNCASSQTVDVAVDVQLVA